MNAEVLNQCVAGAFAGTMTFGETIGRMLEDGVQWYTANLVSGITIHYAADLGAHQTSWPGYTTPPIADAFSPELVVAAIRAIQKREIIYPEFIRRIAAAGTVSYTVHLHGRKVIYFGRHGDFYIEPFPSV